jgi:hypothetical protein
MTEELTQTREKDEQETELTEPTSSKSQGSGPEISKPTTEIAKVGYKMPPIETRFKPGQSGNPSGVRKTKHIRDAALKIGSLDPEKLETYKPKTVIEQMAVEVFKVIRNPNRNSAAAVQAFTALADRIDGKPKPSDEELDSSKNMTVLIGGGLLRKPYTEE